MGSVLLRYPFIKTHSTLGVAISVSGTTSLAGHTRQSFTKYCRWHAAAASLCFCSYSCDVQELSNDFLNSAPAVACFVFHKEQRVSLPGDLGPRIRGGECLLMQSKQEHIIRLRFLNSKYLGNPCRFHRIR